MCYILKYIMPETLCIQSRKRGNNLATVSSESPGFGKSELAGARPYFHLFCR